MSADARVARAIQDVRRQLAACPPAVNDVATPWLVALRAAVDDLIDEAKDALHLTDSDIDQY